MSRSSCSEVIVWMAIFLLGIFASYAQAIPSASLQFDAADGPTSKTIVRNSNTPVTFAWRIQGAEGYTCKIVRRSDNKSIRMIPPSTYASGTYTSTTIHAWTAGQRKFRVRCTGVGKAPYNSAEIDLTISVPAPSAALWFDQANGPVSKTIERKSGTPVTFAWRIENAQGYTCKIVRRPDNKSIKQIGAGSLASGTFTSSTIHAWDAGERKFHVRCTKAGKAPVNSADVSLTITVARYLLTVEKSGDGRGAVTSSPVGIDCGANCSASYDADTSVKLSATPADGDSVFTGWGGACSGTASTCTVKMSAAMTARAVFSNLGDVAQMISAGESHTCALTISGAVKCWGGNSTGQLGNGGVTDSPAPVQVIGLTSGVHVISAGHSHTCALTVSGAIKCWGDNSHGQLGDGGFTFRSTPVQVSGLISGVQAISVGGRHACAVTDAGAVQCWGENIVGQLGDGSTTNRPVPVQVSGLTGGVRAVSAGSSHTCAVTGADAAKCWGENLDGRLGDGSTTKRLIPVQVAGLTSRVRMVHAGGSSTCAVTDSGVAKCWGANDFGQLGDGSITSHPIPVQVSGLTGGVQVISVGNRHSCAVTDVGVAKCWGDNIKGQIGDGSTSSRLVPMRVFGLGDDVQVVSAGGSHTCALTTRGAIRCWGDNHVGQVGDGDSSLRWLPAQVSGLASGVEGISAGADYTCALTTGGAVKCWGENGYRALGDGSTDSSPLPVQVIGLDSGVRALSTGSRSRFSCALITTWAVTCWGYGYNQPVQISGLVNPASTVFIVADPYGNDLACALDAAAGSSQCWSFGQTLTLPPFSVEGGIKALVSGYGHACILAADGAVKCQGENDYGQLGSGFAAPAHDYEQVIGLTSGIKSIAAGGRHTCAVSDFGLVYCWGYNQDGELGNNSQRQSSLPVQVLGLADDVQTISAGKFHTCALTGVGAVKCWGDNGFGQLGIGPGESVGLIPEQVVGLDSGVKAISAGDFHTCAVTAEGSAKCWGGNSTGAVGDGAGGPRTMPLPVILSSAQSD